MGWTSFRLDTSVKKWFIDGIDKSKYEVLETSLVKFSTFYAAIKEKESGRVWCSVYMVHFSPKEYDNFAYKPMDEFCGPCQSDCPEKILKLLTPLTDADDPDYYARYWRERCWDRINNQKNIGKELKKVKNNIIKTCKPIIFSNGESYSYFKRMDRNKFYAGEIMDNGKFRAICLVRLTGLSKIKFEIIK